MTKIGLTQDVQDVVLTLMEGLACPRALTVAILVRYEEWDQIVHLRADPEHYSFSENYFDAVAATDFLRKYQDLPTSIDRTAAAIAKWWWAEKECYKTNERLAPFLNTAHVHSELEPDKEEAIRRFLSSTRKAVNSLIGSRPPDSFSGTFGPGATFSDKSQMATIPDKMSSCPTLTRNALFHLVPWSGTLWASASAALWKSPSFVRGNAFFTVLKDATTDRGCGKEPPINVYYQLGLGQEMKKRLLGAGIDLYQGQQKHRAIARRGSLDDSIVTIDMTSASDTVCTNLVRLCTSPQWSEILFSLRSPYTFIEGKWVKLEKFSSMGNGFTFELESTLFAAIAFTACRGEVTVGYDFSVFGDDLIVPKRFALDVINSLKFFGFTPNLKKTFVEGPFRESCGGDYFDGVGVRPFTLESNPDEPQKIISLANGIRRMACQDGSPTLRWLNLRRAWFKCLDLLPSAIRRCRGPEALGDIVIHDEPQYWDTRWRHERGLRYIRCYKPASYRVIGWEGFASDVQMASAVYGILLTKRPSNYGRIVTAYAAKCDPLLDPTKGLIPRDGVTGYRVGWVNYS